MSRQVGVDAIDVIGIPVAAAIPLYTVLEHEGIIRTPAALAAVVFLSLCGIALWARGVEGRPLEAISVTAFGSVYASGMLSFAWLLRHHRFVVEPVAGVALVMFPIVLVWVSDIAAYFTGRAFGKSKLMPEISPGKTRAGAVGAVVFSVAVAVLYNSQVMRPFAQLALAPWTAALFGAAISVAAQVGDLVESMLKRQAGVKDSSNLLPGHGGILDRLDSLYFALPVAYLVLTRLLIAAPS